MILAFPACGCVPPVSASCLTGPPPLRVRLLLFSLIRPLVTGRAQLDNPGWSHTRILIPSERPFSWESLSVPSRCWAAPNRLMAHGFFSQAERERSHPQVLGARMWLYLWRGVQFNYSKGRRSATCQGSTWYRRHGDIVSSPVHQASRDWWPCFKKKQKQNRTTDFSSEIRNICFNCTL